jgi:hypothetical protein
MNMSTAAFLGIPTISNPFVNAHKGVFDSRDYYDALAFMQQKASQPAGPRTKTAYVIRTDKADWAGVEGKYVKRTDVADFERGQELQDATRFASADSAAEAIALRNGLHTKNQHRYSIVPVKVTTTPATTTEKVIEQPVPAKTEYVLQLTADTNLSNHKGQYVGMVSQTNAASFTFYNAQDRALRFPTADAAAKVIQARMDLGNPYGGSFAIVPVTTPATTVKVVEIVSVPSTTTVELA